MYSTVTVFEFKTEDEQCDWWCRFIKWLRWFFGFIINTARIIKSVIETLIKAVIIILVAASRLIN